MRLLCARPNPWSAGAPCPPTPTPHALCPPYLFRARACRHSGFELHNNISIPWTDGEHVDGTNQRCPVMLWPNCTMCPCKQPLSMSGQIGPRTLQFNTTFVSGTPGMLT